MSRKFGKKALLEAIRDSGGIVDTVAKRLGVSWRTARIAIDSDDEALQLFTDELERVLDLAETTVLESIQNGDTQDAKWLLARKGRSRGYGDNVDVTSGGDVIRVTIERDETSPN